MTRTERQEACIKRWLEAKGIGTLELCTGFGKTRIATNCITRTLTKDPTKTVVVCVPSQELKQQWLDNLIANNIFMDNVKVIIINTLIKSPIKADFLIIDEAHVVAAETFKWVFKQVDYKFLLCLTATLERLDGKHKLIKRFCPVVDSISPEEAINNGWLSPYKEYMVLLEVPDIGDYLATNKEFYSYFSYFNYDFNIAMKCVSDWKYRNEFAKSLYSGNDPKKESETRKAVMINAMGFSRSLQKKKAFIFNHPKKIEITNLILEHRKDKKALTFSPTIKVAEKIKYGGVLHSGQTKKKRSMSIEEFKKQDVGVLNSSKALNTGIDIPKLNLGIILSCNSSKITKTQTLGRIIRFEPGKEAELFTLVLKGTSEENWFKNATGDKQFITINEKQLRQLLNCDEGQASPHKFNITL